MSAGLALKIRAKASGHCRCTLVSLRKCISIHEMRPPLRFHLIFEAEYKFFVITIIIIIILFIGIDQNAATQLVKPKPEEVVEGSEITLKCEAEGNPEPTFEWFRNKYKYVTNSNLSFW